MYQTIPIMTIYCRDILGAKPYPDAGTDLFNRMDGIIAEGGNVVIDLSDVVSLPYVFLNTSIGKFIDVYGIPLLKQRVSFAKISRAQAERITEYIQRYEA